MYVQDVKTNYSSDINVTQKATTSQDTNKPENKITDFGEKIGGARKDDWRDRGLDINDIAEMTDKEKAKFMKIY